MKLLAVDASGRVATVALTEDDNIIAEYSVDHNKTHSQTLLPMIDEIMKITETKGSDLSGIVTSKGPGSFTGLRIGAATVKGLCNSLGIPVCPVSTLEMLAANYLFAKDLVVPLMDARRNQVYSAVYDCSGQTPAALAKDLPRSVEEIIETVNGTGRACILLGDGVAPYLETLNAGLKVPFTVAPASLRLQRAGSLAVLGIAAFREGRTVSGDELELEYLRLSQAERERKEKAEAGDA